MSHTRFFRWTAPWLIVMSLSIHAAANERIDVKWQTDFARSVLDAGASMYVGHGHRAFDGVEVYEGKPLFRQFGGFAYQGLNPEIGGYDEHRPWEGLIAEVLIRGGRVELDSIRGEGTRFRFCFPTAGITAPLAQVA